MEEQVLSSLSATATTGSASGAANAGATNKFEEEGGGGIETTNLDTSIADDLLKNKNSKTAQEIDIDENNDKDDSDDDDTTDRWYAADDGSFFQEKRQPFFYVNFCCYAITIGLFVYFCYVITTDYIDQQRNPPTSTKIQNAVTQAFPGVIVCNRDGNVPLDVIFARYDNATNEYGYDITDQVLPINCGDGDGDNESSTKTSSSRSSCITLDGQFPAFEYDENDIDNSKTCTGFNSIELALSINAQNYSDNHLFLGVDGFLHAPGRAADVATAFCENLYPRCRTLAPPLEACPSDMASLSFDRFRASSRQGNFVALAKSQVQYVPNCDQSLQKWNPVITDMVFNQAALLDRNGSNLGISDNLVIIQLEFNTPLMTITTYNPISALSMFGSLSGWYGFLTDGWGILSLMFFLERTFLFVRDRYRNRL